MLDNFMAEHNEREFFKQWEVFDFLLDLRTQLGKEMNVGIQERVLAEVGAAPQSSG